MWVGEGGRLLGSVTIGGCVDAEVMAEAEDVLAASRPKLLSLDLGDEDAWEIGLTCGGTIEVFVEPVALGAGPTSDGALALYEKVRSPRGGRRVGGHPHAHGRAGRRRQAPRAGRRAPRGVAGRSRPRRGRAGGGARRRSATGVSRTVGLGPGEGVQVFVEVHVPPATLLVVGGSHVAMPLVTLAQAPRIPHGGDRRAAALRDPRAIPRRGRAPGRDPLGAGAASPAPVHDRARARGPRLQVRPAGAPPRPRRRGRATSACSGSRRRGDAILRMLREEGLTEIGARADPGAHRPRSRREDGARDRARDPGRDRRRPLRRDRPARSSSPSAPGLGRGRAPAGRGAGPRGVKAHALVPSESSADRLVGWVLGPRRPRCGRRALARKGERLDRGGRRAARRRLDATRSTSSRWSPATSTRSRRASGWPAPAAGAGVSVRDSASGQWAIVVGRSEGILRVAVAAARGRERPRGRVGLHALRRPGGRRRRGGRAREGHARSSSRRRVVREVEERCRRGRGMRGRAGLRAAGPWRAVAPGQPRRPGRARGSRRVLREKLDWFGAPLARLAYPEAEATALARAVEESIAAGAASWSSPERTRSTRSTPCSRRSSASGGRVVRNGVPAHPGSLLWLARVGVGAGRSACPAAACSPRRPCSTCSCRASWRARPWARRSSPRTATAASSGREMAFRFPPYRAGRDRGHAAGVAACVRSSDSRDDMCKQPSDMTRCVMLSWAAMTAALYGGVILERFRHPRHFGELPGADAIARGREPSLRRPPPRRAAAAARAARSRRSASRATPARSRPASADLLAEMVEGRPRRTRSGSSATRCVAALGAPIRASRLALRLAAAGRPPGRPRRRRRADRGRARTGRGSGRSGPPGVAGEPR